MKTFFKFGLGMAAVLLAGCSSNNLDEIAPKEESSFPEYNVTMTIPEIEWGEGETRSNLYPSGGTVDFSWAEGDVVGVYSPEARGGNLATFKLTNIDGSNSKVANFDGGGFLLISGYSYTAVYPYNGNAINQTTYPVSYGGQNPISNGGGEHLGAYDYLASVATATSDNAASFNFDRLGCFMRMRLVVPKAGTYTSVKVSAPEKVFIMEGQVNLLEETPTITCNDESKKSKEYNIVLGENGNGLTLTNADLNLVIYILIAPVDLSGQVLTFTLTDSNGNVSEYTATGRPMGANKVVGYVPTAVTGSIVGSGSGYPFG